MTLIKKHKLFAILFFLWLGVLLILTYYPNLPDVKIRIRHEFFRTDYIGHLGFYFGLVVFFLLWQSGRKNPVRRKLILYAIIGGMATGIFTELTQSFIPGRSVNPFDMAYNCLGIITGAMMFWLFINKRNKIKAQETTSR